MICRKATLRFSMLISSLPGANSRFPEHKIGVFVLFWPSEPPFLGISSTKSAFLCAFALRNPHFRAFRAQNRGFCAFLAFATLVFGLFEHKIEVFVRFASSIFATAAPASNKPHQAEKYSGLASTLAYLGQMWLPPGRGAAAGWQMVLPDCYARKNLPLRCAGETAAAPETAARKWMPQRWDCGTEEAELRW